MSHKSNRRDFLSGKSAAHEMGDLILSALPDVPAETASMGESQAEHYLLQVSRRAMACEFQVCLNVGQYSEGTTTALRALDVVDALEEQLSFFRETSELSGVNRNADAGSVVVDPGLFEIVALAQRLNAETGGALDITSTPLWEAWGFSRRAGRVPTEAEIAAALSLVGSSMVELDPQRRTIRFRKVGVRLNLGSMGKGFALDRCAEKLLGSGIEHFLIHGGQSSVLARGAQGLVVAGSKGKADGGWIIGVKHPLRPDRRLGEIRLRDRALGTSGSQAQSFWHKGRRYGHIIDPRTGWPAAQVFTATVLAPTALLADALSTAFYVMEPEASLEYCRSHPGIAAVLVCPARAAGGFVVKTAGLTPEEWRPIPPVDGTTTPD
jgi:thiamine biosynthesis lipoprotein